MHSNKEMEETEKSQVTLVNYGKIVGKIAEMMRSGRLSTGDLAELRRISPDKPFTSVLWRLLMELEIDQSPYWIRQQEWERRWATMMMCMAHCVGLHNYNTSFGQGLAEAGWSELRFVQLMRAEGQILEKLLRRVAQYLSSKNKKVNWTGAAELIFFQHGKRAQEKRLDISRDYYKTIYQSEKQ